MQLDCELAPEPQSIPLARWRVTAALGALPREVVERLALIVSELSTNAVTHAHTAFCLRVEYRDGQVEGEVTDAGMGRARVCHPGAYEPHGRGLRIVDQLASEWGIRSAADGHGNSVWFRIDVASDR